MFCILQIGRYKIQAGSFHADNQGLPAEKIQRNQSGTFLEASICQRADFCFVVSDNVF